MPATTGASWPDIGRFIGRIVGRRRDAKQLAGVFEMSLAGGVGAPILFGVLIASGSQTSVALGYALGAALMIVAAVFEILFGVEAAGKSLESISKPLQSA